VSTPAIVVENLTKIFPQRARADGFLGAIRSLLPSRTAGFVAVDDLSFEISEGEIVGLLGPNGAGKSTAVKMLTGILYPTRGIIRIHGLDPIKDRVINARQIGVVFGQRTQLWWDLPVADSLEMLRRIYDVPNHVFKQKLDLFREVLDLHEFLDVPVRRLSLGQRVRSDIAAALLHNPRVIYLDEPTIGVDLSARERIREFIRSINRESGVTVILTTHEMSDVERLCKRIIVMDRGRLRYDGDLEHLRQRLGSVRELVVDLHEPVNDLNLPAGATVLRTSSTRTWIAFKRDQLTAPQLIAHIQAQAEVDDLTVREPEIEQVIRRLYEESRSDDAVTAV
jgi:ABC-2 type transport system ATP-binding protein